jgi:hypothetical protein
MKAVKKSRVVLALAVAACCCLLLAAGDADAAIGVRGTPTSNQNAAGSASLAINVPGGTTTGDVMIATVVTAGGSAAYTAPGGWTAITNTTPSWSGTAHSATYYRVATAAEPASYSWSLGASMQAAGDIVTYTGVNNTDPVGASNVATPGTANSAATPTVSSITANSMIIANATWRKAAGVAPTITKPAATTQRATAQSSSGPPWFGVMTADISQAAAGVTTARTFSASANVTWVMQTIALNPAGGSYSFTTAPDLPDLPGLTLNGQSQTLNAQMNNFAVDDESGSKAGWNVTVNGDSSGAKSAVFARYCPNAGGCGGDAQGYPVGGASLPASSLSIKTTGASFTGGVGTAPAFQCGGSCALDVASPAKVVSAASGGASATWTSTGFSATSVSLSAPTTVRILPASEVYRVDLLWTLGTGP